MKQQDFLGLSLPVTGWGAIAIALSPYILRAIGSQFPATQEPLFSLAKAIEQIITLGAPIDPVVPQTSLALAGAASLHQAKPLVVSVPLAKEILEDAKSQQGD